MGDDFRALIVVASDLSRVMLLICLWVFALEAAAARNGPQLRAFAHFTLALAGSFSWISLAYFDRRFDIIPWADLARIGPEWFWVCHVALIVTLVRLWAALRGGER